MILSLKNLQFRNVYEHGVSCADRYLVMYVLPNEQSQNRLGISVSKRNGNSVVRHRLKRIIKEAYRQVQPQLDTGYDIVLIARNSAIDQKSTRMERSIVSLAARSRIARPQRKVFYAQGEKSE